MNNLTDKQKETIKDKLTTLFQDTTSQSNALHVRGDVNWDCYDKNNWDNMIDLILDIAEILNLDIQGDDNE